MGGSVVRTCSLWPTKSIGNSRPGLCESTSAFGSTKLGLRSSCGNLLEIIGASSYTGRCSERTCLPDGSGVNREVHAPFYERPAGEIPPAYSPRPEHEDVPASRTSPLRRSMPFTDPVRPLEDNDTYRCTQTIRHDRAHGPRRCDERRRIPGLCRTGSHSNLGDRRHRHHGQPAVT